MPKWFNIFLRASQIIDTTRLEINFYKNENIFHHSFRVDEKTSMPFTAFISQLIKILDFLYQKKDYINEGSLSYNFGERIKKLYNFMVTRKDGINLNKAKSFTDGNEYDDKEQLNDLSNSLIEYNHTPNQTTDKNFKWYFTALEISRLSSILGNNSFHEYFVEKLEKDSNLNRYIEMI